MEELFEEINVAIEEIPQELWGADETCHHEIVTTWNGIHCAKCGGWYAL